MDSDVHSDWYTPAEWSQRGPELHKMWDAINASTTDLLKQQTAEWRALAAKHGSPKDKCEAAGGNWSNTRFHKCQMPQREQVVFPLFRRLPTQAALRSGLLLLRTRHAT